ncbi:MAG: glycosyltransferase, partial [Paenibacillus sp.]|uniref:glycosyltransferase n=1 Tax=Paenibacillus sp. TaxID=58172 RepID=UPI0028FE33B8
MEKQIAVSVVVPVYNVEKYLRQCLDSLVCQTLEQIEVIIVNDGSTDASQFIIDEYVQKYPD